VMEQDPLLHRRERVDVLDGRGAAGTAATSVSISPCVSVASGSMSGVSASQSRGCGWRAPRCARAGAVSSARLRANSASTGATNRCRTLVWMSRSRSRSISVTTSSEWPPSSKK
jgi:hypothetical protein